MILSFSTQLNGKPTYFVEKIWGGFPDEDPFNIDLFYLAAKKNGNYTFLDQIDRLPKIHSIREDKYNRWKSGMMIDFFINARQENMFRFAPRIQVVSIQTVFFQYFSKSDKLSVIIDGKHQTLEKLNLLAINDGFDSYEDFKNYFKQSLTDSGNPYRMKIIHWTGFKY